MLNEKTIKLKLKEIEKKLKVCSEKPIPKSQIGKELLISTIVMYQNKINTLKWVLEIDSIKNNMG
jgi:hypothetical protein